MRLSSATAVAVALRELALDDVDAIGFDMDETLAVYRREAFQDHTIEGALRKLVARGHAIEVTAIARRLELGVRGLLIDRRRGNVLHVGADGAIAHAFHGHRRLEAGEVDAAYAEESDLRGGLGYLEIETFFATPATLLYAALVELAVARGEAPRYRALLDDVVTCVNEAIEEGNEAYIAGAASVEDRVEPDPSLRATLDGLRAGGTKVFLLTNSIWGYATRVMTWLLGPAWVDAFDTIVVGARKPAFFTAAAPFVPLDHPHVFSGGHAAALEELLGAAGPRIVYVGDHPRDDLVVPREHARWNTVLIATADFAALTARRMRGSGHRSA